MKAAEQGEGARRQGAGTDEDGIAGEVTRERRPRTLAEKLDHLFRTAHPSGRDEYTHEEVAGGIRQREGPTISATYLWQLRKGMRDNPTKRHLEALAGFFGVPVAYFFDEEAAARVDSELTLLTAMRDAEVRQIALRVFDLSPTTRRAIAGMIEHARQLEGLIGQNLPHDGEGKQT